MENARFHLAWLKLNTDLFMSGRPTAEELQYALVPEDLPAHVVAELQRQGGAGA